MRGLRITAVMLVAAILWAPLGAAVLGAACRPACVTQPHHCDEAAQIASCDCCGHDQTGSQNGTPAEARVELLRATAIGVALPAVVNPVDPTFTVSFHATRPSRSLPLDRPIVFGALLI